MRAFLNSTHIGQMVVAEVVELQSDKEVVVSFKGDLLKINNTSYKSFKMGEKVELIITSLKPFSFKLAVRNSNNRLKINLSV